ncbi:MULTISPECIES: AprI/Inh family metalloprotease inhibitor [Aurantimonas]|uniref:AprI/Inh family metalloprotease inhibitor n=1 Tax=Aurantimonas TaxID=182269 RepID=UPI0016527EA8|nr:MULTISPECIES: AprI/Inh family metalloprotease inhibitor [Aurantimonas]MBC6718742.1 AprI/Inh family metalloprotease inhibitor [Aurantimonas sp. DM33-3]
MTHKMKAGAAVVALLLVAGCSRSMPEMGRDTGPAPLPPAPAGRVSADQLPPPPPPPPPGASTNASADFNASAGTDGDATADAGGNTQVASTSSEPLSRTSMTGFYQVSASGGNCRVGLTLTQYDENYNAASMGCPGRLADVRRWSTTGNQLQLKDTSANVIATLTSSGKNRFTGQTTTGVPVELYR